jgi:hypothetical protein
MPSSRSRISIAPSVTNGERVVLVVALVVTVLFFLISSPWDESVVQTEILHGDADTYHALAETFTGDLMWNEVESSHQRVPGYPLFLAGTKSLAGGNLWPAFMVQSLLHIATVMMVLKLGSLLGNMRIAVIAGMFYATSVMAVWYAVHELFTETLFTFFVVASLLVSAKMISESRQTAFRLLLLGLIIGIATWVRPNGWWIGIPITIALLVAQFHGNRVRKWDLLSVTLVPVIILVAVSPWAIYNYQHHGAYSLSSILGTNLLKTASRIELSHSGMSIADARTVVGFDRISDIQNPFERSNTAAGLAVEYFVEHPYSTSEHVATGGIAWLFNVEKSVLLYEVIGVEKPDDLPHASLERLPERISRVLRESSAQYFLAPILFLKQLLIVVAAGIGARLMWRRSGASIAILLVGTFAVFWVGTASFGFSPRFRIPADPTIFLMAALSISLLWDRFTNIKCFAAGVEKIE